MDRSNRRFKRTIKYEAFQEDLKRKMNIMNFMKINPLPFEEELMIEVYKKSEISKRVKKLPEELQKRIYINTMKIYWKKHTLNKELRPMWYDYKSYIDNQKKKALFDNIHFLHLECNTLEKNKEWIPGCQCTFCLNDTTVKNKNRIYQDIYDGGKESALLGHTELQKRTHCYEIIPNFWNMYMKINVVSQQPDTNTTQFKVFDPLKNQFGDEFRKIFQKPNESPIYFSDEIISQYI